MTKNKITLIQPADFSSGSQWLELVPANQGTRQDPPGQDTLTWQGHSHSLRLGQCRHTNLPHTHSFGTWEETVVYGEYHTDMGGGANSTGTVSPARIDFSLSDG